MSLRLYESFIMGTPLLSIENINKNFGQLRALDNLSFNVSEGEIFGFVGSNGAGKSTTMRIVLGVLNADSGRVLYHGNEITRSDRERIGYMPEERGLYPRMKVAEQLTYFARLHGLSSREAKKNTDYWCERLGIAPRKSDAVQKLSLGNQQRVQLAAALVHNPAFLVLDEPFSGLDPVAVETMSGVLREAVSNGTSVIFSSHQLDLVERLSDTVGIISSGKMVALGTVDELRATPTPTYALGVRTLAKRGAHSASSESPALPEALTSSRTHASAPWELTSTLGELGVRVSSDPLEGTNELPRIEGISRYLLTLPQGVDPADVLRKVQESASVTEFALRRPHLNELFKEAVTQDASQGENAQTDHSHTRRKASLFSFGSRKEAR